MIDDYPPPPPAIPPPAPQSFRLAAEPEGSGSVDLAAGSSKGSVQPALIPPPHPPPSH